MMTPSRHRQPSDREVEIAFHEAGHALMFLLLGSRFASVSVVPDRLTSGRVEPNVPPSSFGTQTDYTPRWVVARWLCERRIMTLLAGPIASERYADPNTFAETCSSDFREAAREAARATGSSAEADAMLQWLALRTRNLLNHEWRAVAAVANALLETPELTEDEVFDAARPHLREHNAGCPTGTGLGKSHALSTLYASEQVERGLVAYLCRGLPSRCDDEDHRSETWKHD